MIILKNVFFNRSSLGKFDIATRFAALKPGVVLDSNFKSWLALYAKRNNINGNLSQFVSRHVIFHKQHQTEAYYIPLRSLQRDESFCISLKFGWWLMTNNHCLKPQVPLFHHQPFFLVNHQWRGSGSSPSSLGEYLRTAHVLEGGQTTTKTTVKATRGRDLTRSSACQRLLWACIASACGLSGYRCRWSTLCRLSEKKGERARGRGERYREVEGRARDGERGWAGGRETEG